MEAEFRFGQKLKRGDAVMFMCELMANGGKRTLAKNGDTGIVVSDKMIDEGSVSVQPDHAHYPINYCPVEILKKIELRTNDM